MDGPAQRAADQAAVASCAAGSADGLEILYGRYAGACLAHARTILPAPGQAEAVVQAAFLALWRGAGRYDRRRSSVREWLLLLTHRRAVEQLRRLHEAADPAERSPSGHVPDVDRITAALSGPTQHFLGGLVDVEREALVLAYWGGRTQREISQLTGAPLAAVRARTCSAVRQLRATTLTGGTAA